MDVLAEKREEDHKKRKGSDQVHCYECGDYLFTCFVNELSFDECYRCWWCFRCYCLTCTDKLDIISHTQTHYGNCVYC